MYSAGFGNCLGEVRAGETISWFDSPGFDASQLEQIRLGLEHGVDVSVYADPGFDSWSMCQIRFGLEAGLGESVLEYVNPGFSLEQWIVVLGGLEQGLEVDWYARPCFDCFQMYEVRRGLELGVDVGGFAYPGYSPEQMRAGLERGLDGSGFASDIGCLEACKVLGGR